MVCEKRQRNVPRDSLALRLTERPFAQWNTASMVKYTSLNACVTKYVLIKTHLEMDSTALALHERNCSINTKSNLSNNVFQATAHKLPDGTGLSSLQSCIVCLVGRA